MLKVAVADLKIGMFVNQLDRPWLETPFLFQGFYIRSLHDIQILDKYCAYVFVDAQKQINEQKQTLAIIQTTKDKTHNAANYLPKRSQEYKDQIKVEDEIEFAKHCRTALSENYELLHKHLKNGNKLDLNIINDSMDDMVDSIIRNPDAFLWLTHLKHYDTYSYNHSIDNSVLAVSFGRHLGLSLTELHDLAIGVLLCDIGKVKLPQELLLKPGRLTEVEFEHIKKHPEYSVEILEQSVEKVPREVIKIARFHHERFNGKGYPNQLSGSQIPVFAQIAAIVDCYNAITSKRVYNKSLSALDAIKSMYEWRNIDFQKDLVEEFIQCLGVFPTGSIVELSSGEIGIVLAQNRIRRLRPRVMLVLDSNHKSMDHFPIIDLVKEEKNKDGSTLEIIRTHEPGVFGIDPVNFFIQ